MLSLKHMTGLERWCSVKAQSTHRLITVFVLDRAIGAALQAALAPRHLHSAIPRELYRSWHADFVVTSYAITRSPGSRSVQRPAGRCQRTIRVSTRQDDQMSCAKSMCISIWSI